MDRHDACLYISTTSWVYYYDFHKWRSGEGTYRHEDMFRRTYAWHMEGVEVGSCSHGDKAR